MKIEMVSYQAVAHLASKASREGVSISNSKDTVWFVLRDDAGVILSVGGLIKVKSGYRIKGSWVEPSQRGKGYGGAILEHRLKWAEDKLASHIETYSYNPESYLKRGFVIFGRMSNGAVKLRKTL